MSKVIKGINPAIKLSGNQSPPRSGAFEVQLNEKLVFSKFETGIFPNTSDIKGWFK